MAMRHAGNGKSKFNIKITDVRPGYMVVHAEDITTPSVDTAPAISLTVQRILKEKPNITVRATMPIVKEGHTIAVHIWYDE